MELELTPDYLYEVASLINKEPINSDWFDIYEEMIEWLVFNESFEEVDMLINSLEQIELRDRYSERLTQLKEWRNFVYSRITQN